METKVFAPWYTYQKKVKAFFDYDPDVVVFNLVGTSPDFTLPIKVKTAKKAFAIQNVLKQAVDFGGVKVTVSVTCGEIENILTEAFTDNLLVREIEEYPIPGGVADYIELEPEVIQFENDDISSYAGLTTYLAETIARDIFDVFPHHGFLCTVDIRENEADEQEVQPD